MDPRAQRIRNRISDGGRCRSQARLAESFCAIRAIRIGTLDDNRFHLRKVERCDQMIVEERWIPDSAPIIDDEFFVQRRADAHGEPAFDLRNTVQRIDRLSNVVGRNHTNESHSACFFVHRNFGRLRRIHVKRGCVLAMSGLRINVFA